MLADEAIVGGTARTVLGMPLLRTTVRLLLLQGENPDGVTVEEEYVERSGAHGPAGRSGPDQMFVAILGKRPDTAETHYQLLSTGETFTHPAEAAARDRRSLRSRALVPAASETGRLW